MRFFLSKNTNSFISTCLVHLKVRKSSFPIRNLYVNMNSEYRCDSVEDTEGVRCLVRLPFCKHILQIMQTELYDDGGMLL